jgi:thioredoxin-dependent peroxiredoxin
LTKTIAEGDKAPDFSLPRDGGGTVSLKDFKGKPVVIYFYPKDDTPGCTIEAKDFTAQAGAFKKAGATVIGVSKDSVKRHDNFKAKYDLDLILASDEAGKVLNDYGVWVEKMNYGRKYMGIERSTFLIDAKGAIAKVWRKVKVKGHADDVLSTLKAL